MNKRQEILNEVGIDTTKIDKATLLKIELAMETYALHRLEGVKKPLC